MNEVTDINSTEEIYNLRQTPDLVPSPASCAGSPIIKSNGKSGLNVTFLGKGSVEMRECSLLVRTVGSS